MRTVICNLYCILVVFPNLIELVSRHKESAVHPFPLRLNVNRYQSVYRSPIAFLAPILRPGFYCVGTDENHKYVIGLVRSEILYPFMARIWERRYNYARVKLLINGNILTTITPISDEDPMNDLFFKNFGPANIRDAQLPGPE